MTGAAPRPASPARRDAETLVDRPLVWRNLEAFDPLARTELVTARGDGIFRPDLPGGAARPGWLDRIGRPYILVLRDAVFYPRLSLPDGEALGPCPDDLARSVHGLLVAADGAVFPDSFGKSRLIAPTVDTRREGAWQARVPDAVEDLPGTWLFGEALYRHFGHALVDMPSRLWPLAEGLLAAEAFDGLLGHSMLGAGPRGERLPGPAVEMLAALGFTGPRLCCTDRAVRVERLVVASRIAPYMSVAHPAYARLMRHIGARLADPGLRSPERLYLSRSRLEDDPRGGPGLAPLDDLFAEFGFVVVHPQEQPFAAQVALVRGARAIAGPVGSQLHLCAFAERPGTRVFSMGPRYFKLGLNDEILADLGGSETYYGFRIPRPAGVRHKAPWSVPDGALPELRQAVRDWLAKG